MTRSPFFDADDFDRELARREHQQKIARIEMADRERAERADLLQRLRSIRALCRNRTEPLAQDVLWLAGEETRP